MGEFFTITVPVSSLNNHENNKKAREICEDPEKDVEKIQKLNEDKSQMVEEGAIITTSFTGKGYETQVS